MSEIKISVQLDNRKNHLHVKDVSEETLKGITKNFFSVVGLELAEKPTHFTTTVLIDQPEPDKPVNTLKEPDKSETVKSRPKQLPLINSNRTLSSMIGDALKNVVTTEEVQPEYYTTGIKEDEDGTKRYKCRYWCDCGGKGNHYIPLGTATVACHSCSAEIDVEPATFETDELNVPVRDSYGNYFVARFNVGDNLNN